jgi:hypothetical protein
MKNLYNSIKKMLTIYLKISTAHIGAICNHVSRHLCRKLPFHMLYYNDKCVFNTCFGTISEATYILKIFLNSVLKGFDDGVLYLIKPRFWTLSIVSGYKNTTAEPAPETLCFYNLRLWTKSKNMILSSIIFKL